MTNGVLGKIEQPPPATLRDIVQDRMRDAIIEGGHFKPGERLVERPLCEQLGGVSRTVVRETIRYLEAEGGLVEILPGGRGPIVAPMSWEDARQIYAIRRMLETAAARTCAEQITPDRTAQLQEALRALTDALAEGTAGPMFRETARFYAAIFEGAGHTVAWEVVQRLNGRISRLRRMTLSTSERDRPGGQDHMKAICDAICAGGDATGAEGAVARHLDDTTRIAERLLADEAASQA